MSELIAFGLGLFLALISAFSTVTETQWTEANNLCNPNGGLTRYVSNTLDSPRIICKNGAKFTLGAEK